MKILTANALRNALDEIENALLCENDAAQKTAAQSIENGLPAYIPAFIHPYNDMRIFYQIRRELNTRLNLGKWYRQRQPRKRNMRKLEGDTLK